MKRVKWRAPSNIALVKYWGKKAQQIPLNPSLSFTLDNCYTETEVLYEIRQGHQSKIEFLFAGEVNEIFQVKVRQFIESLGLRFPELLQFDFYINSNNSFPHSCGIASSASSFAALSSCLLDIINNDRWDEQSFVENVSTYARLGSGSACRSVFAGFSIWGESPSIEKSSWNYAIPITNIHKNFQTLNHTVVIISDMQKRLSSSDGHAMMNGHHFLESRISQAEENCEKLLKILQNGDWARFGSIIENEALTLHALMMQLPNWHFFLEPQSLDFMMKIKNFREEHKIPVYFTIDAGPNIHLVYPQDVKDTVSRFLKNFSYKCLDNQIGGGVQRIDG